MNEFIEVAAKKRAESFPPIDLLPAVKSWAETRITEIRMRRVITADEKHGWLAELEMLLAHIGGLEAREEQPT